MNAVRQCPQCGGDIPPDVLAGHCPRCLAAKTILADEIGPGDLPEAMRHFGDFEILGEIARGGMGIVYRARQRSLNRIVALKTILSGEFASAEFVRRFKNEAEAAAGLRHPNIVTIHEVGQHDGLHYFAMEYVDGPNFSDLVRERPLSPRRAATYVHAIAHAVAHAHAQRVLHRDLKPSNILLDPFDQPRVTDFGLARHLDGHSDLTRSGQAIGSPGYMPPEQALGHQTAIGPASDIYSLGAVLYHLLTSRPPFQGDTVHSVILQVQGAEPVALRRLNPSVPLDLETICLKCLEKDPAHRYPTAQALAEELTRFLNDEPIQARPLGRAARLWRWARSHPAVASLGASVLLLLLVVAIGSSVAAWRVASARRAERVAWQNAEALNQNLLAANARLADTVQLLELRRAEDLFRQHDSAKGLASLAAILERDATNRVAANRLVSALVHNQWVLPAAPPMRHLQQVESVCFSPDGHQVLSVSRDSFARLWDSATAQPLLFLQHKERVLSAQFSPDGRKVVTASADGTARIWNATNGAPIGATLTHRGPVHWAEFSPDGRNIVTASDDRTARLWDAATGALRQEFLGHSKQVYLARFSPDGTRVATGGALGSLRIWDPSSGRLLLRLQNKEEQITALEFSRNGQRLVWSGADGTAQLWDPVSGKAIGSPLLHDKENEIMWHVAFSPDSQTVITAGQDGTVQFWEAETGRPMIPRLTHEGGIPFGQFSPNGRMIVTASIDNTARLWDARTGDPLSQPLHELERIVQAVFSADGRRLVTGSYDWNAQVWDIRHRGQPATTLNEGARSVAFSPDGTRVVTASRGRTVRQFDVRTGRPAGPDVPHPTTVHVAKFSRDGTRVITACDNGEARILDARFGAMVAGPLRHSNTVWTAEFNANGDRAVTASADGTARVWDAQTGQPLTPPLPHQGAVKSARFSTDNRLVLSVSEDDSARVWDAQTGTPVTGRLRHMDNVECAEFSPDSRKVITGSTDNTACIWDISTGRPTGPSMRHARTVVQASFSPDGNRVLTGSLDLTARIWDAQTGQALTEPLKHHSPVAHACFTPDGQRVATACWNGAVRIWDSKTGLPLTEWLDAETAVSDLCFDPASRRLAAATSKDVHIWEVPDAPTPVPDWFPTFAEAVAGIRLAARGNVQLVPRQELEEAKARVTAPDVDDYYSRLVRWFLANPSQPTAGPF